MRTAVTRQTHETILDLESIQRKARRAIERLSSLEDGANRTTWLVLLDGGAVAGAFTTEKLARKAAEALLPDETRFEWIDISTHTTSVSRAVLHVLNGRGGGRPSNIRVEAVTVQGPLTLGGKVEPRIVFED